MEAEDARFETPHTARKFTEPPLQPAMPPTREADERAAYEQKKAEREQQRVNTEAADRRAKALELAVPLCLGSPNHLDIFDVADEMLRYIETGERPA